MWSNFFSAGGFGMYPTIVLGFALLGTALLLALRNDPRHERIARSLVIATLASGLLGTSVGICNSVHYMLTQPADQQFRVLATGCEESLHNLVLALIIVVLASLVTVIGAVRRPVARS
jgi:cytochrome bd-type quinol oxidase subunit 2